MLGKLIKYEFKATYKLMTLIFILMITVSALLALSQKPWRIDEYAVNMFFGSAEILMIILFVVMNVVILSSMFFYSIVRFRKNVLGNEGYLTHTLPVSKSSVIMSKAIVSTVWSLLSSLVVIVSYIMIVFLLNVGGIADTFITIINTPLDEMFGEGVYWFICLIPIEHILGIVVTYLMIYASMAIGYSFNSCRAVLSVVAYIVISMMKSMLYYTAIIGVMSSADNSIEYFFNVNITVIFTIDVAIAVALFFITRYFLKNKLNLQ